MQHRPSHVDKAIILAAGMGTRMGGAYGPTPKPLLPLDGSGLTFLDWHLRCLAAYGAREIIIVGNHATFGAHVAAMDVIPANWLLNDWPGEESGSGHSTYLAFTSDHRILDGRSRVVLMAADLLYDPALLGELVSAGQREGRPRSKALVCSHHGDAADDEVLIFADQRMTPRVHGRGLLGTPLVRGMTCFGKETGMLLLEPDDHALWYAAAGWCMQYSTARARSEHEDITQRLMAVGVLDVVSVPDDGRFMQCDTPQAYEAIRTVMVPRWRSKLP